MTRIEGVLLDIDGVLAVSWRALDGAAAALSELDARGVPHRFLTNTTAATRAQVAEKLDRAGLKVAADRILTAPAATAAYLRDKHPGARCYLISKGDVHEDLGGLDLVEKNADVVVIGGAEENFTYERLNEAFRMLMDGAVLVAMHRNLYWKTDEGMTLDAGAFVAGLEVAAGVKATITGKPSRAIFESACAELGLPPERVAMVGDDIENDVLAAQETGLTGVLVRTGKFSDDAVARARGNPDVVLDSVAELPGWLAGQ